MKKLGFALAALVASSQVTAAVLPQHRFVFEFPESAGTIRKFQVDLSETKGKWIARTKSLGSKGESQTAELPCDKITKEEFTCTRDDNGGGFELVLAPTPKLSLNYFTADEEGSDTNLAVRGSKSGPLSVEGKKAPLSTKDAF